DAARLRARASARAHEEGQEGRGRRAPPRAPASDRTRRGRRLGARRPRPQRAPRRLVPGRVVPRGIAATCGIAHAARGATEIPHVDTEQYCMVDGQERIGVVQLEVRYGDSVRGQYPASRVWDAELEAALRAEWEALGTGRSWNVSSPEIRRGWDYAGKRLADRQEAA